jgi:hypothetical protein
VDGPDHGWTDKIGSALAAQHAVAKATRICGRTVGLKGRLNLVCAHLSNVHFWRNHARLRRRRIALDDAGSVVLLYRLLYWQPRVGPRLPCQSCPLRFFDLFTSTASRISPLGAASSAVPLSGTSMARTACYSIDC